MAATLHLIPVPLAEDALAGIPPPVQQIAISIQHYFVENIRTARRFLKSIDKSVAIDAIHFSEINNRVKPDITLLRQWIREGHRIGVMSEAGCPGVADPGSEVVAAAQQMSIPVIPYVGPSSILLSLMASGFNGQQFRFLGYLPVKEPMRSKAIKALDDLVQRQGETQIFIETPYRNNRLLQDIIKNCHPQTLLCIAANISAKDETIQTKTIRDWKQHPADLDKNPVIFLLGR